MFEVASVREDTPDSGYADPGYSMDSDEDFKPMGGLFQAVASLKHYIAFAYGLDLMNPMFEGLPPWASQKHFAIRARASSDGTKDQMRQRMQSLLQERFQLALHFESRSMRVFALQRSVHDKPGRGLRLHKDGPACDAIASGGGFDRPDLLLNTLPCNSPSLLMNETTTVAGARNITLPQMAAFLSRIGTLEKPVVDETGIGENVDFYLRYATDGGRLSHENAEPSEEFFQDAIKSQLGLKLVSKTASVRVPVVDRVELPTRNE